RHESEMPCLVLDRDLPACPTFEIAQVLRYCGAPPDAAIFKIVGTTNVTDAKVLLGALQGETWQTLREIPAPTGNQGFILNSVLSFSELKASGADENLYARLVVPDQAEEV